MLMMPKAFSKDLRERVVVAYNSGVGTIPKIAELFNLGKSTVGKYLSVYRATGDLTPGKSTGRPSVLNKQHLSIIKKIVLSAPDKTLQDYCIDFEKATGMNIAKSTLWDACKLLDIRRKKRASTLKNKKGQM
jgi:transposase